MKEVHKHLKIGKRVCSRVVRLGNMQTLMSSTSQLILN